LSNNDNVLIKVLRQEKLLHHLTIAKTIVFTLSEERSRDKCDLNVCRAVGLYFLEVVNGVRWNFDVGSTRLIFIEPDVKINGTYYVTLRTPTNNSRNFWRLTFYVSAEQMDNGLFGRCFRIAIK